MFTNSKLRLRITIFPYCTSFYYFIIRFCDLEILEYFFWETNFTIVYFISFKYIYTVDSCNLVKRISENFSLYRVENNLNKKKKKY